MSADMSLLSLYDDIRRNRCILTQGIETGSCFIFISFLFVEHLRLQMHRIDKIPTTIKYDNDFRVIMCLSAFLEFERFVRFQNEWRRQLMSSEEEKNALRSNLMKLENLNKTLETKLKHARNQIDNEIRKRKLVEQDRQTLVSNWLFLICLKCISPVMVFCFRSSKLHWCVSSCVTKSETVSWMNAIVRDLSSSTATITCHTSIPRNGKCRSALWQPRFHRQGFMAF